MLGLCLHSGISSPALAGRVLVPAAVIRASNRAPGHSVQSRTLVSLSVDARIGTSPSAQTQAGRVDRQQSTLASQAVRSTARDAAEASLRREPAIHDVFESRTGSWQYLVADPSTLAAAIIDPVLDYDPATGVVSTETADSLLSLASDKGYKIEMILETHAHADHMTAASYLQSRVLLERGHRPIIGIGKRIRQVQKLFSERYDIPIEEYEGVFDKLFNDDETFRIGNLDAQVLHLPGHTPDSIGYRVGDNVFVGDSVFHTDLGSARADFPGGSAEHLFTSCRKLFTLADYVKIWVGHDYPSQSRSDPVSCLSVRDHRKGNKHLKDGINEHEFTELRRNRDAMLAEPKLMHQSLQMNIRAGRLPSPTSSGDRILHLPLKLRNVVW